MEFLGDLEGGASSLPSWVRSSYGFLTVVPESSRITYGGDSCVSDEIELLYNFLWMVKPHILVLVILEWGYYCWCHVPTHRHVEWTRRYL